jgi:hypothetical protein
VGTLVEGARLKLALLDPQVTRQLGLVAANLVDEALGVLAADERVDRVASALVALGLQMEQRVLLCLHDTIDFPACFLGSIKAGIVPIAANTLLTTADYGYMLHDSRAVALVVSEALLPTFAPLLGKSPFLKHVIVSGADAQGHLSLSALLAQAEAPFEPAKTTCDDACFWLYSSGSTGAPKGTVHVHSSLIQTAELYAKPILGIRENDVVFSAAKLFFAYGLGNSVYLTAGAGAAAVLDEAPAVPARVQALLSAARPTLLFRVFHYPPSSAADEGWGVGEHTDYGLLTLLAQDDIGGLEVKTPQGWIPAPPIPGTLVCNIGDMLDRLRRNGSGQGQKLDLASTIGVLNKQHVNNRVYVSVLDEDPEAMVADKVMPALPLSVMNVMDGMRGTQDMTVLGESSVSEAVTGPLDFVVSGAQLLSVTIK